MRLGRKISWRMAIYGSMHEGINIGYLLGFVQWKQYSAYVAAAATCFL